MRRLLRRESEASQQLLRIVEWVENQEKQNKLIDCVQLEVEFPQDEAALVVAHPLGRAYIGAFITGMTILPEAETIPTITVLSPRSTTAFEGDPKRELILVSPFPLPDPVLIQLMVF